MQPEKEEPDIDAGGTLSESSTPDAPLSEEIPVRRVTGSNAPNSGRPDPLTLAVRDFLALTRQVLPEPTYTHLKNAGREAVLAVVTLFESISNAGTRDQGSGVGDDGPLTTDHWNRGNGTNKDSKRYG